MFSFFERLLPPFPDAPPQQPPNTFVAFCRHYAKGSFRYLGLMALLTACVATIEVLLFRFLGKLVDWLTTYQPEQLLQEVGAEMLWMAALAVIGLPLAIFFHATIIHQTLLGNLPMRIRWQGHRYLLGQSLSFYQDEFAGRVATKLMQTSLAVRETLMKLLDVFLYSSVFFIGILAMTGAMDWRLTLPFIAWLLCYLSALLYFIPRLQKVAQKQADARSEMTGRIVDTYTNITTIKLFSHSSREAEYVRSSMADFLQTVHPQMRLVTQFVTTVWTLNALLIFGVCATAIILWSGNSVSTGAIAAAVGVVMRLYGMSQWVMWEVSGLFENIGTVHDGMQTLARSREVKDTPAAQPLQITKGGIEFRDVTFHYGKGSGVIDHFNLSIRPGEKVGLVGRSGAGKSTLVNLLLRFFDVEAGRILVDGQNIAEVKQESLRGMIGMVTQDTSLLHRSVRDNLLYGRPDASDAEMHRAVQQAKAEEFIEGLEDHKGRRGYDAHVGERGVKLSGGQRQRIAIARVLLKNAPILILDEATSALDSEVEAAIQENLNELMADKTVIAIAHRLSTIAAMDRLVVLDNGRIVEQGTHQELLAHNGVYAQLWAHQSGGFLG
ncbi:MAG: ABC transporter ATP-binding protein/permease [Cellvibrionaceae bacterium]|nr:ABC transporter ATP-binding protein/permease [Cellvibrionaceae bacterium]